MMAISIMNSKTLRSWIYSAMSFLLLKVSLSCSFSYVQSFQRYFFIFITNHQVVFNLDLFENGTGHELQHDAYITFQLYDAEAFSDDGGTQDRSHCRSCHDPSRSRKSTELACIQKSICLCCCLLIRLRSVSLVYIIII